MDGQKDAEAGRRVSQESGQRRWVHEHLLSLLSILAQLGVLTQETVRHLNTLQPPEQPVVGAAFHKVI